MSASTRQRTVTTVTMWGAVGNLALTAFKLVAGICGQSSAMVADAIHSLSDIVSDIVVVVMVRVSNRAIDKSHDYGHGKYETLATTIIAIMLLIVGCELTISGFGKIHQAMQGIPQPTPHPIALIAALISILTKEFLYQWTNRVGMRINSPAMISNAWHHRTDALSSVASAIGIGGAILLGGQWTVLDPIICCIISVFIVIVAIRMISPAIHELREGSLSDDTEQQIINDIMSIKGIEDVHDLKTRRNGTCIILSAHIVVSPTMTVEKAHQITVEAEEALRSDFGQNTLISLHVEPNKKAR